MIGIFMLFYLGNGIKVNTPNSIRDEKGTKVLQRTGTTPYYYSNIKSKKVNWQQQVILLRSNTSMDQCTVQFK